MKISSGDDLKVDGICLGQMGLSDISSCACRMVDLILDDYRRSVLILYHVESMWRTPVSSSGGSLHECHSCFAEMIESGRLLQIGDLESITIRLTYGVHEQLAIQGS